MNQEYNWDLYEEYEDLLIALSKKYCTIIGNFDLFEDLKHAGAIGMAKAAARFKPEMGIKFETFAAYSIKGAMLEEINDNCALIRIPKEKKRLMLKIERLMDEYANEYAGREDEEDCLQRVADEFGLSGRDVEDYLALSYSKGGRGISLDDTLSEDGETSLGDMIADEDQMSVEETAVRSIMKEELEEYLRSFPERDVSILKMRYAEEMTFDKIGKILNISAARVCQIEKAALETLRKSKKFRKFLEYLAA